MKITEKRTSKNRILSTTRNKREPIGCFWRIGIILPIVLLLLISVSVPNSYPRGFAEQPQTIEGNISISGAWALYPLVVCWAEEFQKGNPRVKIDLQAGGAGKGMADVLSGLVDVGMVSREIYPAELSRGAWPIAVARDAVVVTLNNKNPFLDVLLEKGLTQKTLRAIFVDGTIKYWEEIFGLVGKTPINVYTRSDACGAAETWAAFLGAHQEDLKGIAIYGDPGLAQAVRRDPLGLGFNNLNFAYNPETLKPHEGLVVGLLDLNQNGRLEPEEKFYDDRHQLVKAIDQDRYPSPPARDLYLVIKKNTDNDLVMTFLQWVLEKGQDLVEETGYLRISHQTLVKEKQKLQEFKKN
jgi:phosphate transport system substrate-binding protein